MLLSIVHGHSLLLACIYCPPGSCTYNFQQEFRSFVGFLSINSSYYICGVFNIHVDVLVGDGYKFMTFLVSCDLKKLVLLICMVTYWTSFYSPVISIPFVILYLIMHKSNAQLPSLVKWLMFQIKFNTEGTTVRGDIWVPPSSFLEDPLPPFQKFRIRHQI